MYVNRIYKICFSPTGTTDQVVTVLAGAMSKILSAPLFSFDFTLPGARRLAETSGSPAAWLAAAEDLPEPGAGDLVVFGCPTYAGRLPNLLLNYLNTVEGNGALAIPVVTFGNRNFDSALIELRDILENHGFHTIAAAACSCEHSFSYILGEGRPDGRDKAEIRDFAEKAAEKVRKLRHTSWESSFSPDPVSVPGLPAEKNYGGYFQPQDRHGISIDIRKVKPKSNPQKCLHSADCHLCADVCPMGAIDPSDITRIPGICIKCGACTKKCPAQAMYFDDPGYLYHKSELEDLYRRRADNAFFL